MRGGMRTPSLLLLQGALSSSPAQKAFSVKSLPSASGMALLCPIAQIMGNPQVQSNGAQSSFFSETILPLP